MNGIASLAPGQAPQQAPQGPQQGAPTPQAVTGQLKNMPLEQLRMFLMNPGPNSPPLWAVISAVAEKQKEAQAMQMAQGQQVMAQNQQMQQQPPVAAQVMQAMEQEPVMAAHGGMMHGYAGGGAVAFKYAGYVPEREEGESFEDYRKRVILFQEKKLAEEKAEARRRNEEYYARALAERSGLARPSPFVGQKPQVDTSKLFPFGPPESPMMEVPEIQIATSSAPSVGGAVRRQPTPAPAPAPAPALPPPPDNNIEAMLGAYGKREEELRGRMTRPESLIKAEEGLASLVRAQIAAQQEESRLFGEEARAAREAKMSRAERSLLQDPQALFAIAGGMSTRRGEGIGSLARGLSGVMGKQEELKEAARKEYQFAQREERAMQANIRQTQLLEEQRKVALERGEMDRVNTINDQLASLALDREKFRIVRGDVAFQQAIEGRKVTADERRARAEEIKAGKPSELEQRVRLFQQNPEQYKSMFGIDPKETSVELRALKDEEQQLLKRLEATMLPEARKPIEARLDDIIRMRRTLMGAPTAPAAKTMTMADVQATAKSSGKTPEEVRKAAIAAGYTIQ